MDDVRIKSLNIPKEWKVYFHNLVDLEPDNEMNIEDALVHFGEDISYFTYKDYIIDIGYYGEYVHGRAGTFGIFVAKGSFGEGQLLDNTRTRSLQKIVSLVENYARIIVSGEISSSKAIPFTNSETPNYSAIDHMI